MTAEHHNLIISRSDFVNVYHAIKSYVNNYQFSKANFQISTSYLNICLKINMFNIYLVLEN